VSLSNYDIAMQNRFRGRENLERKHLFDSHFSSLGVGAADLNELLDILEIEFRVPAGMLRPEDSLDLLFEVVPAQNILRSIEYRTRAGDGKSELNHLLYKRLEQRGLLTQWVAIETIGDLALAWSGLPPH